jgi:hypothetical protein
MHEFWFRPKTYGFGATPVTWEGWAVIAVYVAVVCAVVLLRRKRSLRSWWQAVIAILIATGAMAWVAEAKTDGAWEWRWGHLTTPMMGQRYSELGMRFSNAFA